jgi:hypothetical protein
MYYLFKEEQGFFRIVCAGIRNPSAKREDGNARQDTGGGEKKMVVHVSVERRYQFERKRGQSNGFDPKKMQRAERGKK